MAKHLQEKIALEFWHRKLEQCEVQPLFPELLQREEKAVTTTVERRLSPKLCDAWQQATGGKAMNQWLLQCVAAFLLYRRYTGCLRACITTALPQQPETPFFIPIQCEPQARVSDVIKQVQQQVQGAFEHAEYDATRLAEAIEPGLWETLGYLRVAPDVDAVWPSGLSINVDEEKLTLHWNGPELPDTWIRQLLMHFEQALVLTLRPKNPVTDAADSGLFPQEVIKREVNPWDGPSTTILELFRQHLHENPEGPAMITDARCLSYREVNDHTNRIARALLAQPGKHRHVAVLSHSSEFAALCALGIMKAGGAYIPLDPKFPVSRMQNILQRASCDTVLIHPEHQKTGQQLPGVRCMGEADWEHAPVESPDTRVLPEHPAYILFTSGSTGEPKGVSISHAALAFRLLGDARHYRHNRQLRSLLLANMTFDISVLEIFQPWSVGGAVVIPDHHQLLDFQYIRSQIRNHKVNYLVATPSYLQGLLLPAGDFKEEAGDSLSLIISGGESLNPGLVKRIREKTGHYVHNHYGPTEITINATSHPTDGSFRRNLIGRPLPGVEALVLNAQLQRCPTGVIGELCIAGKILADGYLNDPVRTGEVFVNHPFKEGEKLYRTGDMVRWTEDGYLEFFGRRDAQVKYNGIRIELAEIEHVLRLNPEVRNLHVLVRKNEGTEWLCAYVEPEDKHAEWRAALEEHARKQLPPYMVPNAWVPVSHFPLTVGGKLNIKALPLPQPGKQDFISPATNREEQVFELWAEILGHRQFGVETPFFEVGGHSLKMARLAAAIVERFQQQIPIQQLFEAPFVRAMARALESGNLEQGYRIQPAPEADRYPLSAAQQRIYLLQQMDTASIHYNMPMALKIRGPWDPMAVQRAFRMLIRKHEALRTSFHRNEGIFQRVHDNPEWEMAYREDMDASHFMDQFIRPFVLDSAPLFRASCLKTGEAEHILAMDMHHIISDGVTMDLLVRELDAILDGRELPPPVLQYKDFAVWQKDYFQTDAFGKHREYWLNQMKPLPQPLPLPTDKPRQAIRDFAGSDCTLQLSPEISRAIDQQARTWKVTPFVVMLSAFQMLLYKQTQHSDIVVGTPVSGRHHPGLEGIAGMFVNTIALRTQMNPNATCTAVLDNVKQSVLDGMAHQDYPFESLVEALSVPRDLSRNPLFDVFFVFQGFQAHSEKERPHIEALTFPTTTAKFDLTLEAVERRQGYLLRLSYATAVWKAYRAEQFLHHYVKLLEDWMKEPDMAMSNWDPLLSTEKKQLLETWNPAPVPERSEHTIPELWASAVAKFPNAIAIQTAHESLTYARLNADISTLAAQLRAMDIKKGKRVAVIGQHHPSWVCSAMALFTLGAVYVPLDPKYPADRLRYIISDSGADMILCSSVHRNMAEKLHRKVVVTDHARSADTPYREEKPSHGDLAYVIYTSGTTGNPKGVPIAHGQIADRAEYFGVHFGLTPGKKLMAFASCAFDASLLELLAPLLSGATLVFAEQEVRESPAQLSAFARAQDIHNITLPPSYLKTLKSEDLSGIRQIISAGEPLDAATANALANLVELYNGYGPTEATVGATYYRVSGGETEPVPIGTPVRNMQVWVMDDNGRLLPPGLEGEICLSGTGISRGYLNLPPEKQQAFTRTPWSPETPMYHTGDRGMWRYDGQLLFLRRADDQVQVRGMRVEMGEIVEALMQWPEIVAAEVVDYKDHLGITQLAACVVAESETVLSGCREHLERKLPPHMVPQLWLLLDHLPLTPNGKVDRKVLQKQAAGGLQASHSALQSDTEKALAKIWCVVLGRTQVGRNDHFFQVGGHSITGMQLLGIIENQLHVQLGLKDIFAHPVLYQMAEAIDRHNSGGRKHIAKAPVQPHYPLSPAQKRLYVLHQMHPTGTTYNMPGAVMLHQKPDIDRLNRALQAVVNRHEILRTAFVMVGDEPRQMVREQVQVAIEPVTLMPDRPLAEQLSPLVRPFHLEKAPLIRVCMGEWTNERWVLFYDLHHLLGDGPSMRLFMDDLLRSYAGEPASDPPLQFKDIAVWQNEQLQGERWNELKKFWAGQFPGEIPELDLPTDFPRPAVQQFDGDVVRQTIPAETGQNIRALCNELDLTLNSFFLAAMQLWIAKMSHQDDVITGIPVSGRNRSEMQSVMGMFVNTIALRTQMYGDMRFNEYCRSVHEQFVAALDHQEFPFEELVEWLDLPRNLGRNPVFDVMYTFFHRQSSAETTPQILEATPVNMEAGASKFDLTLEVVEKQAGFELLIQFSTALFRPESIDTMCGYLIRLVEQAVNNPEYSLKELALIPATPTTLEEAKVLSAGQLPVAQWHEQVSTNGQAIAVVGNNREYTYAALRDRAEKWAAAMQYEYGVKAGDKVAVSLAQGPDWPAAIFAIWLLDAVYVPVVHTLPEKRRQFILENAGVSLTITDRETSSSEVPQVAAPALDAYNGKHALAPCTGEHPAYIIYTSGSTGNPKGVVMGHGALQAFTESMWDRIGATPEDRIVAITTPSFDISVLELVCPLLHGMSLACPNSRQIQDPAALVAYLRETSVTLLQTTPSRMELLTEHGVLKDGMLQQIVVGGEAMSEKLFKQLAGWTKTVAWNAYGPTETCIWSSVQRISAGNGRTNIGRALTGETLWILDQHGAPLPVGIPGEIGITGVGLSAGYHQLRRKTAEVFVHLPFLGSEPLYRTGDKGRWLPNGEIEYLGRLDDQLKVRGFRIEPGEIEKCLSKLPEIERSAVVLHEQQHDLAAFYTGSVQDREDLRTKLSAELPDYMIPAHFIHLETLPVNNSGKTDKKALRGFPLTEDTFDTQALNPDEEKMLALWQRVGCATPSHPGVSFFACGGNSVRLIRLLGTLSKEHGIDIPLPYAFAAPRLEEMARWLDPGYAESVALQKEAVVYNPEGHITWILFPPAAGLGYAYADLAEQLPHVRMVCLHFPESGDPAIQWQERISRECENRAVWLGGYSIGGNLAYEMATQWADRFPLTGIILIDGYGRAEPEPANSRKLIEDRGKMLSQLDQALREWGLEADAETIKERVATTIVQYQKYMADKTDSTPVNLPIYLLKSSEQQDTPARNRQHWESLGQSFQVIQAVGTHVQMLSGEYAKTNASLLEAIWRYQEANVVKT